nr:VCBS repeat-containing protein [Nannocystis pusilla]
MPASASIPDVGVVPELFRGRRQGLAVLFALGFTFLPAVSTATPWRFDPQRSLPADGDAVTQKVELVDFDADGHVDLVFANSRGDADGDAADAQLNQLVRNEAGQAFVEQAGVFAEPDNAYVIKAADVDEDGDPDLVVGVNFGGQSYVLLNEDGTFVRHELSPGESLSIGDLELGDVDLDGDLDIIATDWGEHAPFGEAGDLGGPLRLWAGDGEGGFVEAGSQLPMGVENLVSWSLDLELFDFDDDFDLDVMVASRGPGPAVVLLNDGTGVFSSHQVPALADQVLAALSSIDLDGDGLLDVLTLQDAPGGGRNSVLRNDGHGDFLANPGPYWGPADNPVKLDFDAATLDFENDGTPDVVVTGLRWGMLDVNTRLLLNSGVALTTAAAADGAAFPVVPELAQSFGLQLADLDHDGRDDAVVAVRDELQRNAVLFGSDDPQDGVPPDTTPPRIGVPQLFSLSVHNRERVTYRARVDDAKVPSRWHDFRFDPQLAAYNLTEDALTAHRRRLPYVEFAFGLEADELIALADDDPNKQIAPGVWFGEALWRFSFTIPDIGPEPTGALRWRICAVDAAGNKGCGPVYGASVLPPDTCGDGVVDPWERCDDPEDPSCISCAAVCGDCICEPLELDASCPVDCSVGEGGPATNIPPPGMCVATMSVGLARIWAVRRTVCLRRRTVRCGRGGGLLGGLYQMYGLGLRRHGHHWRGGDLRRCDASRRVRLSGNTRGRRDRADDGLARASPATLAR